MRKERSDGKETREAILAAAVEEFTAKGFEGASTRSICARAGVNNALMNRYYGTKENLYRLVAKSHFGDLGAPLAKLAENVNTSAKWKAAIREWISDFLYMTLPSATAQIRCVVLFRQEITRPTKFQEEFKRDFGRPLFDSLYKLFSMATESGREALLWTSSVWAERLRARGPRMARGFPPGGDGERRMVGPHLRPYLPEDLQAAQVQENGKTGMI